MENTIKIRFNGAYAEVLNPNAHLLSKLRFSLSYTDSSIEYSNKFNLKGFYMNPEVSLLDKNTFLTGLLSRADCTIRNSGYTTEYQADLPEVFPISLELPDYLYDHQKRIIEMALKCKRGIIQSPTGSGKTVALAHLIKHFPNQEVLVVVPETNLMEQNALTIENVINEPVGRVSGKKKLWQRVTVGVVNSLANVAHSKPALLNNVQILIVDECHRVGNGKFYNALSTALFNTDFRIGLSATPNRDRSGDQLFMEGILGPLCLVIKEHELISKGIIMQPYYFSLNNHVAEANYSKYDNSRNEYRTPNGKPLRYEVYMHGVVHNPLRNRSICTVANQYVNSAYYSNFPAMILVETIEHGYILQKMYQDMFHVDIPYISGDSSSSERKLLLDQLRSNSLRLMIASRVFNEGQDVPALGLGIIASGGSAENRVVQQVGRFIRSLPDKLTPIIVDFNDVEYYYLLSNSISREKAIRQRFGVYTRSLDIEAILNKPLFDSNGISPWALHDKFITRTPSH